MSAKQNACLSQLLTMIIIVKLIPAIKTTADKTTQKQLTTKKQVTAKKEDLKQLTTTIKITPRINKQTKTKLQQHSNNKIPTNTNKTTLNRVRASRRRSVCAIHIRNDLSD